MNNSERLRLVFRAVVGDQNARSLLRWKLSRKDCLLYEQHLRKGDLVYDVGGYLGDLTCGMLERYQCEFHVFEPHPEAFCRITERFAGRAEVKLHEFALGGANGRVAPCSAAEASSIVSHRSAEAIQVKVVAASEHLRSEERFVALMKLNIEGAEFEVLEKLLWSEVHPKLGDLLIQFHPGVPGAKGRYSMIADKLRETHFCSWSYPFFWELWRRKKKF